MEFPSSSAPLFSHFRTHILGGDKKHAQHLASSYTQEMLN